MSDVLDITEQLQKMADLSTDVDVINTGLKAIDEIERQTETIEKLRAALKLFQPYSIPKNATDTDDLPVLIGDLRAAAAALKETGND